MAASMLWLLLLLGASIFAQEQCQYSYPSSKTDAVEVFWINMDKSASRRQAMQAHLDQLGVLHRRVRGLSLDDIHIPGDILSTWNTLEAQIETKESIPATQTTPDGRVVNFSHVMSGLVGRAKGNQIKEIGCTSSHLEAMRQAIFENRTASRYALITEDDIFFPFSIDFQALTASAPSDFGILQLFNSNEDSMRATWQKYVNGREKSLWTEHRRKQALAFWSTCAYLIDRDVLRPVIERIAYKRNDKIHLKVIAGIEKPCRPKFTDCCQEIPGTSSYAFQHSPPCFWAPKGFQADSFLYTIAKTYVLHVPVITNGQGGNESTFHQDHVEGIHASAFARQRQYINQLISTPDLVPSFLRLACRQPLRIKMELHHRPICPLPPYLSQSSAGTWPSSLSIHVLQSTPATAAAAATSRSRRRPAPASVPDASLLPSWLNVSSSHARYLSVSPAVRFDQLYLPRDIVQTWDSRHCLLHSSDWQQGLVHLPTSSNSANTSSSSSDGFSHRVADRQGLASLLLSQGVRFVVTGLCGRRRTNHLHDLPRTLSHLSLLHTLLLLPLPASSTSTPRYALVMEQGEAWASAFSIDWTALLASAPADFVFLRLVQSDGHLLSAAFHRYLANASAASLWPPAVDRVYDEQAAGLYLVALHRLPADRLTALLRPVIAGGGEGGGLQEAKVIAGLASPCCPADCCAAATTGTAASSPVHAACQVYVPGIQAERFLWQLGPTYTLAVPLFTWLSGWEEAGRRSKAQATHRRLFNDLINGRAPLPAWAARRCLTPVQET